MLTPSARLQVMWGSAMETEVSAIGLQKGQRIDHRKYWRIPTLDGRNRARVSAESLARVLAAIRITSVRWRSYLPLKTQNLVRADPAFVALQFESRDWRSLV